MHTQVSVEGGLVLHTYIGWQPGLEQLQLLHLYSTFLFQPDTPPPTKAHVGLFSVRHDYSQAAFS